jgi:hypothetical protein
MPTPEEIEAAAGIAPANEIERKRLWAAAQAHAKAENRAPSAEDLRVAEAMLTAAAAATDEHLSEGRGRAVVTLTDAADEEVEISAEFTPQLEELPNDEVAGTPAQITALQMLEMLEAALGGHDGHIH